MGIVAAVVRRQDSHCEPTLLGAHHEQTRACLLPRDELQIVL